MQQDPSKQSHVTSPHTAPSSDATTSITPEHVTPSGDVEDALHTMAEQLAEEPTRLRKRQDVTHILEKMTDGVVVTLHIGRPRFTASVAPKRGGTAFGLEKLGITNSEEAQKVVREYFSLGRHSLLPTELQKELAAIENTARACLDRFAFKTHWGYFIPTSNYKTWKAENEKHEKNFLAKKQYVIDHFDEIMEQVLTAYRTLAEDAWMQSSFGSLVVRENRENLSEALFQGLYRQLESGEGKAAFIQTYLSYIQSEMPSREEVEDAFEYETELGYIPLPSLLARDINEADHVVRSRSLRDAKLRAEMDVIEAQKRAELDAIQEQQRLEEARQRVEWQKLSEQQRVERQAAYLKLQVEEEKLRAEREKIEQQRAMDRDVLNSARTQQDQLVQEFYTGIIAQINQLVKETCEETLESLDEQRGILRGPVSIRLGNLVKKLKNLNFIEDETITGQIQRLEAVLPTEDQRRAAARGIARIETSGIHRVVQQIQKDAEETLIELHLSTTQRTHRQAEGLSEDVLISDEPRKARWSLEFGNQNATGTKRRRPRGAMKL
jgi:hypothetical protein